MALVCDLLNSSRFTTFSALLVGLVSYWTFSLNLYLGEPYTLASGDTRKDWFAFVEAPGFGLVFKAINGIGTFLSVSVSSSSVTLVSF